MENCEMCDIPLSGRVGWGVGGVHGRMSNIWTRLRKTKGLPKQVREVHLCGPGVSKHTGTPHPPGRRVANQSLIFSVSCCLLINHLGIDRYSSGS